MNKIALFTVFYPGAEPYVEDFFESIKKQTRKDFDLIIVNDGYKETNLQTICQEIKIVELEGVNNISKNRELGINYVVDKKYDYLILCDVDDYFSPLRVEKSIDAIYDVDLVINDIDIIDSNSSLIFENYFSKSIDENQVLDYEFILTKNLFGFSNTALRVSKLHKVSFPLDLCIVDWFYFTVLLKEGLKAKFVPYSLTKYRQHASNMIGISFYTLAVFKKLLELKIKHYSYFVGDPVFDSLYEEMLRIDELLDEQKQALIDNNEKVTPYPLWWQNIRL